MQQPCHYKGKQGARDRPLTQHKKQEQIQHQQHTDGYIAHMIMQPQRPGGWVIFGASSGQLLPVQNGPNQMVALIHQFQRKEGMRLFQQPQKDPVSLPEGQGWHLLFFSPRPGHPPGSFPQGSSQPSAVYRCIYSVGQRSETKVTIPGRPSGSAAGRFPPVPPGTGIRPGFPLPQIFRPRRSISGVSSCCFFHPVQHQPTAVLFQIARVVFFMVVFFASMRFSQSRK